MGKHEGKPVEEKDFVPSLTRQQTETRTRPGRHEKPEPEQER
ncbi:hypothetical protein ACFYY8_40115 [Streptosporangium sp. NPDC001559]